MINSEGSIVGAASEGWQRRRLTGDTNVTYCEYLSGGLVGRTEGDETLALVGRRPAFFGRQLRLAFG